MPRLRRWAPWAVFGLTAAAFLPALGNAWVDWDDDSNFLVNPHFRGFSAANLRWMLTAVHNNHYHPLTWLSIALDHSLWGMRPAGYHLTSLLLHAATAAAFFFVARRLLAAALPRAGEDGLALAALLAALLFGVHPLRVESVAWASERRDVLSGLFYLLTVLLWLKSQDPGPRAARWKELSLACYAASLLSKAIGVTLPAALLILDAYPLRRLSRETVVEKLPYLLLAAAATALGLAAEAHSIALHPDRGLLARLGVASYGAVFYLAKTVLPTGLIHLYPIPDPLRGTDWPFPLCLALAAAATAAACLGRRGAPWLAAAWFYYLLTLAPVSGLIQFGPQLAADRYSYLSCLPWALLAGPLLARRRAAAAAVVAALAVLTARQTLVWRDSGTLWAHAAAVDPSHAAARNYLGNHAYSAGRYAEAASLYETATLLRPRYAAAHNNLGNALLALGRRDEAIAAYERAAALAPDNPAPRRAAAALRRAR